MATDAFALSSLKNPQHLRETIAYSPGGIVSRALIQKPQGSVTLFAFDAGQALSEHSAAYDALATVLEGEGVLVVEDTPFRVSEGQTLWFPAGRPHSVRAETAFKMLLVMIRG